MRISLTMVSGNTKVGPIPVSTTDQSSCPSECPLKGSDCYARFGPLGMHWNKLSNGERGTNWQLFINAIKRFHRGQVWRHNQAGDLPQNKDGTISHEKCVELSNASKHTKGWTYTHYNPLNKQNAKIIAKMNSVNGMTVNLSADNLKQADEYHSLGIAPICVILPKDAPKRGNKTPNGLPIVVCPAQIADINCANCQLCQKRDRKSIVGFIAHGTAKKRLSKKLENNLTIAKNMVK